MQRFRHAPLLHFACLGLLLWTLRAADWLPGANPIAPLETDAALLYRAAVILGIDRAAVVRQRLSQLSEFLELERNARGQAPAQDARDLGLVESDPVIRRHLEHLADLALHRGGAATLPTEAEVAQYYQAHAHSFLEPPRVRLAHIYFSFERRGTATEAEAYTALERLRGERLSPADVASWGDPLVRNLAAGSVTRTDLERAFGAELAAAIETVPIGIWTGPLRSPYGLHLVWIHERIAATPRPLIAVRNQIVHRLARERGEILAARRLELLRQTAARTTP